MAEQTPTPGSENENERPQGSAPAAVAPSSRARGGTGTAGAPAAGDAAQRQAEVTATAPGTSTETDEEKQARILGVAARNESDNRAHSIPQKSDAVRPMFAQQQPPPPPHLTQPLGAEDMPLPRTGYGVLSGEVRMPLRGSDLFASTSPRPVIAPKTLTAVGLTADANGNKLVYAGTIIAAGANSTAVVRASTADAIGVLMQTVNLKDGPADVPVLQGNAFLRRRLLRDYGSNPGTYDSGVPAALAAMGIYLRDVDA